MKIKLDIDCTPEEARAFLGLPDLAGIQNEMLEKFRDRMAANLKYADPQEMFKLWFGGLGTGLRPPAKANRATPTDPFASWQHRECFRRHGIA